MDVSIGWPVGDLTSARPSYLVAAPRKGCPSRYHRGFEGDAQTSLSVSLTGVGSGWVVDVGL